MQLGKVVKERAFSMSRGICQVTVLTLHVQRRYKWLLRSAVCWQFYSLRKWTFAQVPWPLIVGTAGTRSQVAAFSRGETLARNARNLGSRLMAGNGMFQLGCPTRNKIFGGNYMTSTIRDQDSERRVKSERGPCVEAHTPWCKRLCATQSVIWLVADLVKIAMRLTTSLKQNRDCVRAASLMTYVRILP